MPPSSSLSSPTADGVNYDYVEDAAHTAMSNGNDSADDALALPPMIVAGEDRKVQPEEVAIVTFILGRNSWLTIF